MHRSDVKPRAEVLAEMAAWLEREHGITMLGGLGFENAYALAMPRAARRSARHPHASPIWRGTRAKLSIAGDYEFFGRPEWEGGPQAYGLTFREQRQMQPEFMYQAVANGEVDVIAAYTSDGRIAQLDLVVLDDPRHAIPPYDAVLLVSPQRANDAALRRRACSRWSARSTSTLMREANLRASAAHALAARGRALAVE